MYKGKSQELLRRALSGPFTAAMYDDLRRLDFRRLQTVLLHLMAEKAHGIDPSTLLRQYCDDRFAMPGKVNQTTMTRFDLVASDNLPEGYEALELSPVTVLGTNHALAGVDQKLVLGTIRRVEVMADSVTALTMEAAKRRKEMKFGEHSPVRLATSHREIRVQAYDPALGFTPHFRSYSLATMASAQNADHFALEQMVEHIRFYLNVIKYACASKLAGASKVTVAISNMAIMEYLIKSHGVNREVVARNTTNAGFDPFREFSISLPARVLAVGDVSSDAINRYLIRRPVALLESAYVQVMSPLSAEFPDVIFEMDLARVAGIGYYPGLCFKLSATSTNGQSFPLVDGGGCDWGKLLTGQPRERVFTSGMGSELFCRFFSIN